MALRARKVSGVFEKHAPGTHVRAIRGCEGGPTTLPRRNLNELCENALQTGGLNLRI